jgi:serine protease Do
MNQRHLWSFLGLGALCVALLALPGSSQQKQEPCQANTSGQKPAHDCSQMKELHNQVLDLVDVEENQDPAIQVFDDSGNSSDDDLQFFMASRGGWLGVGVSEVSSAKAKDLKLPEERGAMLGKIVPDSPAAKAGLQENDVVLEINGQRVEGAEQFRRMIHEIPSGRTANLTVWRGGRSQNIKVTLGKQDSSKLQVLPGLPKSFSFSMPELKVMPDLSGLDKLRTFAMVSPGHPLLGIDAESLEGDFGRFFGAPDGEGVLIREVFPGSPAAKAGLKVGDVITTVDGNRIHSASELREKLLTKKEDKAIQLGVLRNKTEMTVSVELPQREEDHERFFSERTEI